MVPERGARLARAASGRGGQPVSAAHPGRPTAGGGQEPQNGCACCLRRLDPLVLQMPDVQAPACKPPAYGCRPAPSLLPGAGSSGALHTLPAAAGGARHAGPSCRMHAWPAHRDSGCKGKRGCWLAQRSNMKCRVWGPARGYHSVAASHSMRCKWHLPLDVCACNAKASRYPLGQQQRQASPASGFDPPKADIQYPTLGGATMPQPVHLPCVTVRGGGVGRVGGAHGGGGGGRARAGRF